MKLAIKLVPLVLASGAAVSCTTSENAPAPATDSPAAVGGATAWQSELTPEMKAVLDQHAALNPKPIETLTPAEARQQPTPADAVMALMKSKGTKAEPEPVGKVENRTIPGPGGPIPVRVYTPSGTGPFPVMLYIHGGGWVIATIDTYDSSARALCNAAKAVVVSIEYRKGPEHKFPAAHDDAFASWQWLVQNAASIGGDPAHADVAGESAGGNMALAVALMARDKNVQQPKHVLAVYPVSQLGQETPSIQKYADAKPLNKPMLAWFGKHYTNGPADMQNPLLNLLKADVKGLPPTTIVTAQIDPLMSEGKMMADKLEQAGVKVRYRNFDGVTHEFFGMGAVVPQAKEAVRFAAEGLM